MTGRAMAHDEWVVVNGERRPLPPGGRLLDILEQLGLGSGNAAAVAVNDRVVRKAQWPAVQLAPGDRIEVVRPMQGG